MYNLENFYDFRMGCVNALALLQSCLIPEEGVVSIQQEDLNQVLGNK